MNIWESREQHHLSLMHRTYDINVFYPREQKILINNTRFNGMRLLLPFRYLSCVNIERSSIPPNEKNS